MHGGKNVIKMEVVYLDTNIFITFFLKRKGFKKMEKKFKENKTAWKLVTSDWTLTEVVKVLTNEYKKSAKKIINYIQELQREKRIFGEKFSFVPVSKERDYDFGEFFYGLQKTILEYENGVPDSIHSLIMKNNNIKYILTTDSGFQGVQGLVAINPLKD